jgi:hypothetical protein
MAMMDDYGALAVENKNTQANINMIKMKIMATGNRFTTRKFKMLTDKLFVQDLRFSWQ